MTGLRLEEARGDWDDYGRPSSVDIEDFKIHYQRVAESNVAPTIYLEWMFDPEAGEISSYGKIQTLLSSIRQGILAGASI